MGLWNQILDLFRVSQPAKELPSDDFMRKLPIFLIRKYGRSDYYTLEQVLSAAKLANVHSDQIENVIAMFCTREDFERYLAHSKRHADYDTVRSCLADEYFEGNVAFSRKDVKRVTTKSVERYGYTDSGTFGGGSTGDGGSGGRQAHGHVSPAHHHHGGGFDVGGHHGGGGFDGGGGGGHH